MQPVDATVKRFLRTEMRSVLNTGETLHIFY